MIPFRKMSGLGNDFVVVDVRRHQAALSPQRIRALADRSSGIGFDQFIWIAPPTASGADATMRIANADGGEVEACGNAARCVAALLMEESGTDRAVIDSAGGRMLARRAGGVAIAVDMGVPRFEAEAIPLAGLPGRPPPDPLRLTFAEPALAAHGAAACVNVGNPHAVFFVADVGAVPLEEVGPLLERHPVFPERANITFATITGPSKVVARVWERGVGPTRACGTAACAVGALGSKLALTRDVMTVELPGGPLRIAVRDGRIIMTGPYSHDFSGTITHDAFTVDALERA